MQLKAVAFKSILFSIFVISSSYLYAGDSPPAKFTGTFQENYPSGVLYKSTEYKNGIKEGTENIYSLEKKLKTQWHYKNGQKDGKQFAWFEDGAKRFEYNYVKGLLEGEQIEWHQNGQIFRRQYFKKGYETQRKILFENGDIITNYSKKNNRLYGFDAGELCFDKKKDGEK